MEKYPFAVRAGTAKIPPPVTSKVPTMAPAATHGTRKMAIARRIETGESLTLKRTVSRSAGLKTEHQ